MDGTVAVGNQQLNPPSRLFERLRQIAGYTWDESREPFHSSYDNWQVVGTRNTVLSSSNSNGASHPSSRSESERSSTHLALRNSSGTVATESTLGSGPAVMHEETGPDESSRTVIARLSTHALREERAFAICKNVVQSVDPEANHFVKPLDIVHLASQPGDKGPVVVCIFEHPGLNYIARVIDYGPAWYYFRRVGEKQEVFRKEPSQPAEIMPLERFLDFAVGAAECLEILHHGQRIVHGEIRGDAFHMNIETGSVKLVNFGSGLRTFEHGLTSTGWSTLSKELGAKTKLSFMSPEQTGRMPAEPDSRTDIYSLGILFWTLLTQQPAFDGHTPMEVIQGVLSRRLPSVCNMRFDIPDVIGRVIQKMTAKLIGERYHSASGLRHDLTEIRKLLGAGDSNALNHWQIATRDVSSFFILPTVMIGRAEERDQIVKIIDKVSRRHFTGNRQEMHSLSSGSSTSDPRIDSQLDAIASSNGFGDLSSVSEGDGGSGYDGRADSAPANSTSISGGPPSDINLMKSNSSNVRSSTNSIHASQEGHDLVARSASTKFRPWDPNGPFSIDSRSTAESNNSELTGLKGSSDGAGSLTSRRNSQKFRRRGRCEVITIAGAAGLGKSCLVQSVQIEARRRGYFASSKFDQAKKSPFGPVLRLLSSLFKQVFSEPNTDTDFHNLLKAFVRPAWPMLSKELGLPEFVLGPMAAPISNHSSKLSQGYNKSLRSEFRRRESSPSSNHPGIYDMNLGTQNSQEYLRAGTSTKSTRLMNTFLDILRVFSQHKFICFCLDDLQFADEESLDMISQIISSRMKMVIIVTYRPMEISAAKVKEIVESPLIEEQVKSNVVGLTKIELRPLGEEDILQYVSTTLWRPKHDIVPLAAVIQSKTAGNPFYMREMLDTCHRKQCIWYDYKESIWLYDLDRVFKQFATKNYHDTLNSEFVTSRLNELPAASRSIIAWASLIGTTFSFELIQRLMGDEFEYGETMCYPDSSESLTQPQPAIVEGLQAAIQAYIVVPTEIDDRFRFTHDRYIQAAASLREFDVEKMHFIIAQTLIKYPSPYDRDRSSVAYHICGSIDVIRERVRLRATFRKALADSARNAAESGARTTAARFYSNCFALMQDDPWKDGDPDVFYDETLQLYNRAAECYLYMGNYKEATQLLTTIISKARSAVDTAPAWVLQSRIYAQESDLGAAFKALKQCLLSLDIHVDGEPTFEKCDREFERLAIKIQTMDREDLLSGSKTKSVNLGAIGAVLAETVAAAFWTDSLIFYQMALVMVNTQLTRGNFPQAGVGFLHMATVAVHRFNMIKLACEMGDLAIAALEQWQDPLVLSRGLSIYNLFVAHLQHPIHSSVGQLESILENTIQAGDRLSTILNFGIVANLKLFASEHLADLESFCTFGCEEIPNWELDTRGGTMMIAIRQATRAMQRKTYTSDPYDVMGDDQHKPEMYKTWLKSVTKDNERAIVIYEGLEIVPLFLFGHYDRAIEIGDATIKRMGLLWSARSTRFTLFFYALSLACSVWAKIQDPLRTAAHEGLNNSHGPVLLRRQTDAQLQKEIDEQAEAIEQIKKKLEDWQVVESVNYVAWSKLLAAQISEMRGHHGEALIYYEESLDHAAAYSFLFEEALGNYLLAGFFLRVGSRRPAKATLRESIMLYRQFGATGVASHIEEQNGLLLQDPTKSLRAIHKSTQTDFAGDSAPVQYETFSRDGGNERQQTRDMITETNGERIGAWQGGSARPQQPSAGLPTLDMLDLTSILESSQAMSSILQVDQLLKTMTEIILQNCGGLATQVAIVVEDDELSGWSIAASGDPERGAEAHIPGLPLNETAIVVEGVILYCTRFRETVFLADLVHDERFSNVSEAWATRNPVGKSVIAIPICYGDRPLLGVLYLEGQPNAFTDRNLTVLQLLVNQIGISYSNALTLKKVERVSAFNNSMVDVQKKALAKALEAETKANLAKAEALRSVKLAEEAAKAKSIFLANVSHELRTPLNGVIGNSELLRDSDLRKEQAEMADSIRVSADLLLTVINDILDFSKMEADKMKLFIVAFNADEMMREVVRSVSYSNRDKGSSRSVKILQDVQLPQSLVFGDPVRLHQVLGNLIGNSLKFTENGSITIGARTEWETKDEVKLTFWVKDTGIGIPKKQLVKLFKPFSQADASTARKYGGSGLGLSICKSLIESMMGGSIKLESTENVGTTAIFSVTFAKANAEASAGDSQKQPESTSMPVEPEAAHNVTLYNDFSFIPREQLRIAVAEDNPINQKIAIQFMEKIGFKSIVAYDNGQEAVEGLRKKAAEGNPYHVILMDVQMPVLDGYEATKLLRKDKSDAVKGILVIAMTASAIQGDREKCLASGMNDYLAKPVRSLVLKKKLDQYLQPPAVPIQNLEAEAKSMAKDVLEEMNGSKPSPTGSPSILDVSADSTPTMRPASSPSPAASLGSTAPVAQRSLERMSSDMTADADIGKSVQLFPDDLSPRSIPRPIHNMDDIATRIESTLERNEESAGSQPPGETT